MSDHAIAFMTGCANGRRIVGLCCAGLNPEGTRMYRVNFGDYKQTCHHCGRVIVEPKTAAWPELFLKNPSTALRPPWWGARFATCNEDE